MSEIILAQTQLEAELVRSRWRQDKSHIFPGVTEWCQVDWRKVTRD